MTTQTIDSAPHATWFVGASYGGTDDQMPRFLAEGIWENGYDDKLLDVVRSMRPGERIAIKSSYTRKHGLPFDSRGRAVSVMGIKAVGTITENLNDGKRVKVDWAKVEPVPPGGGGGKGEADIDKLSAIIKTFNDLFGNIEWKDEDKIRKVIAEEIPARVAKDKAYQNAQANSDKQNAKLEHDKALNRVVLELLSDHTELFKQFSDNPNFKRWLTDTVFDATYQQGTVPPKAPPQAGASAC